MLIFSSIRTHPIFPRAPPRCAPSGRLGRPFAVGPLAGDLFLGSKDFVDVQDEQFDSPGLRSRSVNREATDISLSLVSAFQSWQLSVLKFHTSGNQWNFFLVLHMIERFY